MAENQNRTIAENFIRNVQRQKADAALAGTGVTFDVFFDSADVQDAAVGVQGFYETGAFDQRRFDSPRALVQALFSAGWLGTIKMLPPHQAEFLSSLELGFGVGSVDDFVRDEADFYGRLTLPGKREVAAGVTRDALAQYVFKSVEFVSYYWRERLIIWQERGLLRGASSVMSFAEIVASSDFRALRSAFDQLRPDSLISNFADAAALTAFARLLQAYNRGEARALPLIFAKPLFRKVVAAAAMTEIFTYESNGTRYSTLCDAEYLILRAILFPAGTAFDTPDDFERYLNETGLPRMRDELFAIVESASEASPDTLAVATVGGRPLGADLLSVKNFAFFEWVWLPAFRDRTVPDDRSLADLVRTLKSASVRKAVTKEFLKLHHELLRGARSYHVVRRMWERLDQGVTRLKEQFPTGELAGDPIIPSGLVRFSLPLRAQRFVKRLLPNLLKRDASAQLNATGITFEVFRQATEKDADVSRIATAAALLWLGELYEELHDLLQPLRGLHQSLLLMYASATAELHDATMRRHAFSELEHACARASTAQAKAELAIGAAYVAYHVAIAEGFKPTWEHDLTEPEVSAETLRLVDKAIDYARRGVETKDAPRAAYALNLLLYYSVARGVADHAHLRHTAVRLLQFKPASSVWQFRYDDTLARYFYLLALRTAQHSDKSRFLGLALQHIEDAYRAVNTNRHVNAFRSKVVLAVLAGNPGDANAHTVDAVAPEPIETAGGA